MLNGGLQLWCRCKARLKEMKKIKILFPGVGIESTTFGGKWEYLDTLSLSILLHAGYSVKLYKYTKKNNKHHTLHIFTEQSESNIKAEIKHAK